MSLFIFIFIFSNLFLAIVTVFLFFSLSVTPISWALLMMHIHYLLLCRNIPNQLFTYRSVLLDGTIQSRSTLSSITHPFSISHNIKIMSLIFVFLFFLTYFFVFLGAGVFGFAIGFWTVLFFLLSTPILKALPIHSILYIYATMCPVVVLLPLLAGQFRQKCDTF